VGLNPVWVFGFNPFCEEAIQVAFGRPVDLKKMFVPVIMHNKSLE
jgi:hypothetical protein